MARAAEALRIPVVSGNVSLYNETDGRAITADAGGRLRRARRRRPHRPRPLARGRRGARSPARRSSSLAGSEYQALYGELGGRGRDLDLAAEATLVEFLWRAAPLLSLAHDASAGGLAVALAEAALWSGIGAELELPDDDARLVRRGRRTGGDRLRARGRRAARAASPLARDRRRRRRHAARRAARRARAGLERLDVRRVRHPRPRPRRRAARALRAARAPAPRPGVGRHRRLRRRPPDRAPRDGPGHAGLRRAEAQRPARRARDRAHALLDDRLGAVVERAADRPARPRAHGRARAQRQPRQRGRAARRARGATA